MNFADAKQDSELPENSGGKTGQLSLAIIIDKLKIMKGF
jgi:hypothetical protein